jgi:flagellar assembly protein FliH
MAENRIIARAKPAGTRRLAVVPPETEASARAGIVATGPVATAAPPTATPVTGLNAFLAAAQRQGAELVEVARQQAERIAGEARSEGYETGYAEGRATAERETADLLAFAESAVREVAETRQQLLDDAEPALVRLAIQVAEKVLQAKLELEPERVADVLRGALRKAYVRNRLTVVCNPDDIALIEAATPSLHEAVGTLGNLELVGDRRIKRGGVIVRTDAGDVDATLDAQLTRLREVMLGGAGG